MKFAHLSLGALMKIKSALYSIILVGFLIGIGCPATLQQQRKYGEALPVYAKELSQATVLSPLDLVWEMIGQVNGERALTDIRKLSGEEAICIAETCYTILNRRIGSTGLQWAKDYVLQELTSLGYTVEVLDWTLSGNSDQNLIVRKPGLLYPGEEVYFVAHLDGVGSGTADYPAADDNASGVVDLLELARVLSHYSFSRSVVLLFTTGEEQGTLGVTSYLDQLTTQELEAIRYAVNIDMIGYDGNPVDGVMELWHANHAPSVALTQRMADTIVAYQLDLTPTFIVGCG
jgi:hypothetical protein